MAYDYAYAPAFAPWHFMPQMMHPRKRHRPQRRDNTYYPDPWDQLFHAKQMLKAWEDELTKDKKKEDKKPPSGWEQLQMFMAQISIMIVFGYPLGKLFFTMVDGLYK